jgi:hypothetical protein
MKVMGYVHLSGCDPEWNNLVGTCHYCSHIENYSSSIANEAGCEGSAGLGTSVFVKIEVVDLMESEREIVGDPFYALVSKYRINVPTTNWFFDGQPNSSAFYEDYNLKDNLIVRMHDSLVPRTVTVLNVTKVN